MPINQLNLPAIHQAAVQTQGMKQKNAMADFKLNQTRNFNALAGPISEGDEAATRKGLAVDATRTSQITDAISKMDESQRARTKEFYTDLAKGAAWATTQPKWNHLIDRLNAENNTDHFEQYRDQFENRGMFINKIRDIENIIGGAGKDFTLGSGQTRFGPDGKPIASVARDPNSGPNAVTPPQQANNAEIGSARKRLEQLEASLPPGVTLSEELQRRMSSTDPRTGRQIPDYNSFWGRTAWKAAQARTGGDPDQDRWSQTIMGQQQQTPPDAPRVDAGPITNGPAQGAGPTGPATVKGQPVDAMSVDDIDSLLNGPDGGSLTPEEITAIDERLKRLGY